MTDGSAPLTPAQTAPLLGATLAALTAELGALPDHILSFHPKPGEWCAREVLGHLIEAERRGFAGRIRIILAGNDPKVEAWDPPAVARARGDCRRDVGELLAEFATEREASRALVVGLTPADLARGCLHPKVGYLRVSDLLHEWVHHDRNHLKQIMTNVQDCAWPHMGNAQGFAGE